MQPPCHRFDPHNRRATAPRVLQAPCHRPDPHSSRARPEQLTEEQRASVGSSTVLPLLPTAQHHPPDGRLTPSEEAVFGEYTNSTSCQACHFAN